MKMDDIVHGNIASRILWMHVAEMMSIMII